jgi:FKBP-type peptidyl-prolyl cis-trans isomerase SlyD
MNITARKVVTLDYTLKNAQGEVLDTSDGAEPLAYLHGASEIVPGLEQALEGLKVGDAKDIVVEPKDGYGDVDPSGVFAIPRSVFPESVKPEVGDSFVGEDDEGNSVPVWVMELRDTEVVVNANHPLAGEQLHYHVVVREIRDATPEELEHGHSHGPDDEHHEEHAN